MAELALLKTTAAGVTTSMLRGGGKEGRPIVFLHGATPGLTPYAGGNHLWGGILERTAETNPVLAIELLGAGGTGYPEKAAMIDEYGAHLLAALSDQGIVGAHVVGHDLGGAAALWLALHGQQAVGSITVAGSAEPTPLIDTLENLTFYNIPGAPYSGEAQRWAYERISASTHHIDDQLIAASVTAASFPGPRRAQAAMADPASIASLSSSIARLRGKVWTAANQEQFPVPAQFIWGQNDPLTTRPLGFKLFEAVAAGQPRCTFHLIPRAGSLMFREQPALFLDILTGFVRGLDETSMQFHYGR